MDRGYSDRGYSDYVEVDDLNVVVDCELPAMAKNFIGDQKVAASIEKNLRAFL